jgi:hypothetical protein
MVQNKLPWFSTWQKKYRNREKKFDSGSFGCLSSNVIILLALCMGLVISSRAGRSGKEDVGSISTSDKDSPVSPEWFK